MNGIPAIGINLHVMGTDKREDVQVDILSGDEIDTGFISLIPELCGNPEVQEAIKEIIRRFPDKEVIDMAWRGENAVIVIKSMKSQQCPGRLSKNLIDLAGGSRYNGIEVIYLSGMAFAFPAIQKGGLWLIDIEIRNAVSAADQDAQYDDKAKRLLGNKIILAHILVKTVDEFRGMNPKDVVSYIEGEPFISVVPVEPGLTNVEKEENGQRIVGMNTENAEINEGLVRFDIIFYVRMKDGISQVIVNVEAQKDEPSGCYILNRAVFYVSRLVSSQKERDFVKTHYNDIKRVFSIWICMNMDENSMDYVHLTDDKLLGSYSWKGGLDLLNIVLIGISNELPEHDEKYELHRLLSTLLSMGLTVDEKLGIIEKEYSIVVDDRIRKDVSAMCNLSQGIRDAENVKIIMNMHRDGYSSEQIARIVEKKIEEVEAVIRKKEPVLA